MEPVITIPALGDNYIYIYCCERNNAFSVDPSDAGAVLKTLGEHKLCLTHALATHRHFDHTAGIEELKKTLAKTWIDGPGSITGFIVAVIGVCVLGALLASYVGRSFWRTIEKFIMNTPILRNVFPYVKQVTDFLLTNEEQKKLFSRVVAVEYPRKGIWSVGFVTGSGLEKVVSSVKREFLTVLIPTSPTPFTGFVITVPKKQTIDLDMTVEEALRFIVSGGVITPGGEQAAAALPQPDSEKEG